MAIREFLPQLTLTASVKENSAGGETLSFIIPMGAVQIICIANIPGEGEREAPAYVKFKIDTRDTQALLNNRQERNANRRPRYDNDAGPRRGTPIEDGGNGDGYDNG
ncbi:MAG: hypothetical protein NUW00_05365 [Candidatus Kaiserbacteria bacterium]|nr:hypothetical protein [Candidatus Kaiserbacteria bacterium]